MNSIVSINNLDLTCKPASKGEHSARSEQASDESEQEEADFKLPCRTDMESDEFDFESRRECKPVGTDESKF